jgi:uncharacterized protein YjiK
MKSLKINLSIVALLLIAIGCKSKGKDEQLASPPGYNISNPVIINLKTALDEISGIFYYPKDTAVFAIVDEIGALYKIYLRNPIEIKEWSFGKDGDYEDMVLHDSTFYVLQSSGRIAKFKVEKPDSIPVESLRLGLEGKNEFESLYYDDSYQKLIMICKNCKGDKDEVKAYGLDPLTSAFTPGPIYSIKAHKVLSRLQEDRKELKPSAAAIHPLTKDLYIVSSVNKALIIASRDGKVHSVYALDPKVFKQPEGITFTPTGDMLISNEAAEVGSGNILIFKYKPKG